MDQIVTRSAASEPPALSAKGQRWQLLPVNSSLQRLLAGKGASPLAAAAMAQQFSSLREALEFAQPQSYDDFLNKSWPDLRALNDLDSSADRLASAIINGERIGISGDYDCDGNCSVALLVRFLRDCGVAPQRLLPHIPNREADGYGINIKAVEAMQRQAIDLLLTLDNGTLAFKPLQAAAEAGMDVIVADHHPNSEGQELPQGAKVINPNRHDDPVKDTIPSITSLAAVGVTFLLALRTAEKLEQRGYFADAGITPPQLRHYLGLVALATIGDVVNLSGPLNRTLTREGLKVIAEGHDPYIKALIEVAQQPFPPNSETLAFQIAPIINAPGRLGQSVAWAFLSGYASEPGVAAECRDILLDHIAALDANLAQLGEKPRERQMSASIAVDYPHERMLMLLSKECNEKRKELEGKLTVQARQEAQQQMRLHPERHTLIINGKGWHPGLIGIVAGRLKEAFQLPIVVASENNDGICKASARSIKVPDFNVDIGEAFRTMQEEGILDKAGGHPMAAGATFRAPNLEAFRRRLDELIGDEAELAKASFHVPVAGIIDLAAWQKDHPKDGAEYLAKCIAELDALEPFGEGNAKPKMVLTNVMIDELQRSRDNKHFNRLTIRPPRLPLGGSAHHAPPLTIHASAFHVGGTAMEQALVSGRSNRCHLLGTFIFEKAGTQGKDAAQLRFLLDDLVLASPQQSRLGGASIPSRAIPCLDGATASDKGLFAYAESARGRG